MTSVEQFTSLLWLVIGMLGFIFCVLQPRGGDFGRWYSLASMYAIGALTHGYILYLSRKMSNAEIKKLVQKYGIWLDEEGTNFGISDELIARHKLTWKRDDYRIACNNRAILAYLHARREHENIERNVIL